MLISEYHSDRADDGVAVGEDSHEISVPADIPIEPLGRVIRPHSIRSLGERQQLIKNFLQAVRDVQELQIA